MVLIMFISFLFSISTAIAAPQFSFVEEGGRSPIEGVAFNPDALSEVLVKPEQVKQECEIEWKRTLEKKENGFLLEMDKQKISYDALNEKHAIMVTEKDKEISELQEIIKNQSPTNKWMWFAIGIAGGGVVYYSIDQIIK